MRSCSCTTERWKGVRTCASTLSASFDCRSSSGSWARIWLNENRVRVLGMKSATASVRSVALS